MEDSEISISLRRLSDYLYKYYQRKVITTISDEYADCFGFTEKEVTSALKEYGYENRLDEIRQWYDGFTFGETKDIYNPWSIINFLATGKIGPYWTNTSSNRLAGTMIQKGSSQVKETFENLLNQKTIQTEINEQVVYEELDLNENAIWSLLLASGYLKVVRKIEPKDTTDWREVYELTVTNQEVLVMFKTLVRR